MPPSPTAPAGSASTRWACRLLRHADPDLVVLEQVNAMPGTGPRRRTMGAQTMFNFGRGFGVVEATVQVLGLPLRFVAPATWKARAGLTRRPKDYARTVRCSSTRGPICTARPTAAAPTPSSSPASATITGRAPRLAYEYELLDVLPATSCTPCRPLPRHPAVRPRRHARPTTPSPA